MAVLVPRAARDERAVAPGAPSPGPDAARPARSAPVALTVATLATVALVAVLVAALVVGGGDPQPSTPGLPSAGPLTGWGLPVVTLLLRTASIGAVGTLLLAALLVPRGLAGGDDLVRRAGAVAGPAVLVWLLAEAARLVLLTSSLLAAPVLTVRPAALADVLTGLAPGRAALVSAALLLAVLLLGLRPRGDRRRLAGVRLVLALAALLSPVVLAGHSAGSADHVPAVTALAVHVVTAAAWVGGLGAVLLLGRHLPQPGPLVRRFSGLALGCVVLLAASGLAGAAVLTGATTAAAAAALLGTGYGMLLLTKTAALAVLALAGAWHRRRTIAALEAGRPRAFRRLAVVELAVMAATVAVAVGLAASPPPSASTAATTADFAASGGAAPDGPTTDGGAAAGADEVAVAAGDTTVDPMAGHDHGELSVGVLVDDTRFHVARPVQAGLPVTVYNSGGTAVTITAADGGFDVDVPARTFVTFPAPERPGRYDFSSRTDPSFADTLVVQAG